MKYETQSVELEGWMWKQILGDVRHSKHTARTEVGKEDARKIESALIHQLEL